MFVNHYKTFILLLASFGFIFTTLITTAKEKQSYPLPEFTENALEDWINSPPLSVSDLEGKVVMLDIWTYGCWNCYRSIPWMLTLEERFGKDRFQIIGIHTPEFDHEHERKNVIAKTREFNVTHPVMMDNDFSYWKALRNRYWPTFYIVDKQGDVRGVFIGETHENTARANQMESLIAQLLQE
ncbi:MAG: thioredoxin-like domain-containing protein [Pseudomonadota bacterium]